MGAGINSSIPVDTDDDDDILTDFAGDCVHACRSAGMNTVCSACAAERIKATNSRGITGTEFSSEQSGLALEDLLKRPVPAA